VFASPAEVEAAHAHGAVALEAEIGLRLAGARVHTTVGRVLLFQALGGRVPFERVNGTLDAGDARALIEAAHHTEGLAAAVALVIELRRFGARIASGSSLARVDFESPTSKQEILAAARARCAATWPHAVHVHVLDVPQLVPVDVEPLASCRSRAQRAAARPG
jgi:hypothetical protein